MFKLELEPRFNDTDALGHINNASYLAWFEDARKPVFKIFNNSLDLKKWNLILARIEVDYLFQGNYNTTVEVLTEVEKVGNSSFVLIQKAIQNKSIISVAKTTLVHFDYKVNKAATIPENIKVKLSEHIVNRG